MKCIINKQSNIPYYLQLYNQFRGDIVSGIYPYNSKLPSKRTVAEEFGVSTITVEHAYALLCDEGYIEARERSGYFIIFRSSDGFLVNENVKKYIPHTQHHVSSYNELSYSLIAKTMRRVMSDYGEDILEKSENCGCDELKRAIRKYLARSRGINVEQSQIVIGSGSEYLYTLIVELMGRNRIYAIESPSYEKIEQVYRASDVKVEMLPLCNDGIESSSLRSSNAHILHISPYRSYPSGVSASASKRHEYLRWASAYDRYIIEDDFESEFSVSRKPEETLFSYTNNDNVIYMNTFSKTISPSLRVGYMVLPKHMVSVFEQKLGFYSCTVSTFIQLVLAELINNGDFERHINRVRRKKRKALTVK